MNLHNRHSERSEESPNSVPSLAISKIRRVLDLYGAVCATAFCLVFSINLALAPPVHAFSKQTRAAGAVVFQAKGCEHCHGVDGIGTDLGPELLDIGKRWKKDRIEQQILNGGGGMPPFADALQPDEVKSLVDFLNAKRKTPKKTKPTIAPKPAPSASDDTGL